MPCTSPREVGFKHDGKTLSWNLAKRSPEYPTFQLPCGKCIDCRLDYSRHWAVRCVHESMMHENNCFITLTYSDENLKSDRLIYSDFQKFMKKLRKLQNDPMGVFVTGEYGDKTKRPHWHAIIFNWIPNDLKYFRSNERGDKIYKSAHLEKLWGHGHAEVGSVTFQSAGYVARYAAKKLGHGNDQDHSYHPISKKSSKHAIGKKWLEKYWPDVFSYGRCILKDGTEVPIPRYYEKWFAKEHPEKWIDYVTNVKFKKTQKAEHREEKIRAEYLETALKRPVTAKKPLTPNQVRKKISEDTFKNRLQKYLKL